MNFVYKRMLIKITFANSKKKIKTTTRTKPTFLGLMNTYQCTGTT